MKTLILNCGSSSLKYQLINSDNDEVLVKGLVEKIGTSKGVITYKPAGSSEYRDTFEIADHGVALEKVLQLLTDTNRGIIKDISQIDAVGHRVVHGGETYSGSVHIDNDVIKKIEECIVFAPLHNPPNLMGIRACAALMPGIDQVAVFDTAFHQNMPEYAFLYALPYSMYEKHGVRRYGFHGTSHAYVSKKAADILGRDYDKDFKVIVCHLGNGASVSAIKNGISIDTSMGFTPLEGLVMGTRCGDIDPAIIPYLMEKEDLSSEEMDTILNKQSGLKGISRTTNDMREVMDEAASGSRLHQLAFDVFCYHIKKYIGAYMAVLNGADAIVFTAGIGENSAGVREAVLKDLDGLGITFDTQKNDTAQDIIGDGKVKVMVVATDEELAIAHETKQVLSSKWNEIQKQRELQSIQEQLSAITGPVRTQIVLLWSQNKKLSKLELQILISKKIDFDLSSDVFDVLLSEMGIKCAN